MNIRQAAHQDLNHIMAMIRDVVQTMVTTGDSPWDETYPDEARFAQDIAHNSLYIAEVNNEIIGVVTIDQEEPEEYRPLPWSTSGAALLIHRLAVSPRSQKQGIASELEAFACRLAWERGIAQIRLDTYATNTRMQAFLAKKGYRQVGEVALVGKKKLQYFCYEKILQ